MQETFLPGFYGEVPHLTRTTIQYSGVVDADKDRTILALARESDGTYINAGTGSVGITDQLHVRLMEFQFSPRSRDKFCGLLPEWAMVRIDAPLQLAKLP